MLDNKLTIIRCTISDLQDAGQKVVYMYIRATKLEKKNKKKTPITPFQWSVKIVKLVKVEVFYSVWTRNTQAQKAVDIEQTFVLNSKGIRGVGFQSTVHSSYNDYENNYSNKIRLKLRGESRKVDTIVQFRKCK